MKGSPNIARVGALVGDPARAGMLGALMGGQALSAGELAREVAVTAQTASAHLAKLEQGGLLRRRKQGRHHYFELAGDEVARLLEAMMGLTAENAPRHVIVGPKDVSLRHARVCYNHLAGDVGVRLFESLLDAGHVVRGTGGIGLTERGRGSMSELGLDVPSIETARSPACLECLDWSERRSHLAGGLGRALLARFEARRWVKRRHESRALDVTPAGRRELARRFPSVV